MVHEANKLRLCEDTEGTIVNKETVQYVALKTQLLQRGA